MFERDLLPSGVAEAVAAIAALMLDPIPTYIDTAVIATTIAGVVAYWNDAAERLYGWKAKEALGQNVVDLTPASYSRAEAEAIMARLQAGEAWDGEIVLRGRGGAPFLAYVMDLPVGDLASGQGAIVGVSLPAEHRRLIDHRRQLIETELHLRFRSPRG
ncbi:PAS domain-containing protein [Phenylobacterium soli]|uniref:PAS domain-containing protein n=1 Tax=Phenylobacterium soli TaxID=2170551 RepID=A0A328AH17_9CAUL|nr:PAS domain-containing protein [Phenylobacterium soli]RAK53939.1 hypothetical protein DJ017_05085 [Phenylobacterium soli]